MKQKRLAILGSTGSIGRQAMEVVAGLPHVKVCALAARASWQLLGEQAAKVHPEMVALTDEAAAGELREALTKSPPRPGTQSPSPFEEPPLPQGEVPPSGGGEGSLTLPSPVGRGAQDPRPALSQRERGFPPPEILSGEGAMTEMIRRCHPDVVLTAVVGTSGLAPTLAAIECGADLAIANKETLVMAGAMVMRAAREAHIRVLPVDSEHSAIFQCLTAGRREEVRRVVVTASGGALRDWSPPAAENATVAEALNHPTWRMGRKITIDSATLVNKALEVVEAHWLFDLRADQIEVLLHPQSIVHSYVEFCDGSVIAQMGNPDMMLPIAYALSHPQRPPRQAPPLDLAKIGKLTFHRPEGRFARAVALGFEVIRKGGAAGAVLNGANEAAVEAFLAGTIKFGRIVPMVEDILREAPTAQAASLQDLLSADAWARAQVNERICGRV